ncbi:MAG: endonuclease domain-containing protein [Proteobacteria bacterium]|nr:endonuclease domain-containing protein [Pseudomonadota bacterium]
MKHRARDLRKKQTEAEKKIWQHLRNREVACCKFRRQHVIGSYIVDFVCLSRKLIVEVDGGQHVETAQYDTKRTEFLQSKGFAVIRFWNNDVLINTDAVMRKIYDALTQSPSPRPSPPGERELFKRGEISRLR